MDELLTATELASRLRVRPETVKSWARTGVIPTIRVNHKVHRFDYDAVKAALERKRSDSTGGKERNER